MDSLEGSIAVVTGAGSGIGRGIALALAKRGVHTVVADLSEQRAHEAAKHVHETTGVDVLAVQVDVSDQSQVERLADRSFDRFGNVDILCNNAGTATVGYCWEIPLSDWQFVLGVNLMGAVHGVRAFLPRMLSEGRAGHVVNTSSMAGLVPVPLKAPYVASKHALVGFSKTLRSELESIGAPIGVSVVCPGPVATKIIDDEIARYDASGDIDQASQAVLDGLKTVVDSGISGEQAGEIVVDAVAHNHFWVFPNSEDYFGAVDAEFAEMRAR